jgi:hypothetical protein
MTKNLLDEIEQVQYPSVTMLNRVEQTLTSREALADYAEVLVRKVETTHFPSISLLNRVDELIARLERGREAGTGRPRRLSEPRPPSQFPGISRLRR